jgi:hypothetical protein
MPHPNHPLYQDVAAFPTSRLSPYTCRLCPGMLLFCCYQGSAITRHRTLAVRSVLSTNCYDYAAPTKQTAKIVNASALVKQSSKTVLGHGG